MTKQVVADKFLQKAVETYVEKHKRDALLITEFDNKSGICSSNKIERKLAKRPKLVAAIRGLFEDDETETDEIDKVENNLVYFEEIHLPKLSIPFKTLFRILG